MRKFLPTLPLLSGDLFTHNIHSHTSTHILCAESDSGMVVIEAGLHTGHVADAVSLSKLVGTQSIKRYKKITT